jgi:DNA-binding Lrp family transcriptional regulator
MAGAHGGCKAPRRRLIWCNDSALEEGFVEKLDALDLKLLAALQEDGQATTLQLAERVGLSASGCSRRRTRLEAAGVIEGVHVRLNPERLGFGVVAFVQVTLARHSPDNALAFRALVARTDAVQQAYAVTGDADYILRVAVLDLKHLAVLVNDVLLPHPSVAHVRSMVALDRLKDGDRLPLSALSGE